MRNRERPHPRNRSARPYVGPWLVLVCVGLLACPVKPPKNDPDAHVPLESRPIWHNWTLDLKHFPATDGENYYFSPTTRDELRTVVRRAAAAGVDLRASGQRHSQPPLVADDNRNAPPEAAKTWLVDLSCYADLGPKGDEQISLDARQMRVTVNTGVREDYLDAFLAGHDLMLKTVTAGGFFSLGGMTAVDVHGASVHAPIFAETVTAFTVIGPDGGARTIEAGQRAFDEGAWEAIQFGRVSLGALGVVTRVTIEVMPRKHKTTVTMGRETHEIRSEAEFVDRYLEITSKYDRIESFFNPYKDEFLVLWWKIDPNPADKEPNAPEAVASSCTFAEKDAFGSPLESPAFEWVAQQLDNRVQLSGSRIEAEAMMEVAVHEVRKTFDAAVPKRTDLWLTKAARVAFMSYFVELPRLDAEGLARVWQSIDVVRQRLKTKDFLLTGPMEFRFVRGGDSALAGTYTDDRDAHFVNLDMIAFVEKTPVNEYPQAMLDFFADVERKWYVDFAGLPHNGKMYGFFDPTEGDRGLAMPPFANAFLTDLAARRGERLEAFERFRRDADPKGLFCNDYLRRLSLCRGT